LGQITDLVRAAPQSGAALDLLAERFGRSSFPKSYERVALILYAAGHKRILISRPNESFEVMFGRLLGHARRQDLACGKFHLQMDFVREKPVPVDLFALVSEWGCEPRFEVGVDGLEYRGPDGKLHLFLPGDAYVRSAMSIGQVREYLERAHGAEYLRKASYYRFRSESYLSSNSTWLRLYRGYPVVGSINKDKIGHAIKLAIGHIQRTQDKQGKFLYYYDAARDSRRDHEHPKRDLVKNPYYNILRHCGGGLSCIYFEKWSGRGDTLPNVRMSIEYLLATSLRRTSYHGREAAYIYSERKAKLGGSGIALYLLADYQLLTGDDKYRDVANQLAWHLLNQITDSGEFIYYNIYLDEAVLPEENQRYFSFYYPGEAICGLAKYLHLVEEAERGEYFAKIRLSLDYLLNVRPAARAEHYTDVPSDSWLMMGILELWDFEAMRAARYVDFVYADARKMIDHMYKVSDAPYPDYAGSFYYAYGDYPYADGARCEGLLGALALAWKIGDWAIVRELWPALKLAAWGVMHLVNTEDAIYSAPNPSLALGGIRFKHTRQWFRIDTIQHVASFYAKLLPYWDAAENIMCEGP